MKVNQKRILVSSVFMLIIAIFFWTGSRYPQLNEKALLGADNESMGISFDIFRTIQFRDSWLVQVLSNTANWIETNKKGMAFGLFFGAILMVLFSLLKDYKSNNRWVNAIIGTLIGAPLGVCVNCAAPIAMGMKDAGAKTETAMAAMVSSPTLNVIVLSMLFSLLPPYMVWFKLGSTIVLLLFIIPLLSRYIKTRQENSTSINERKLPSFFKLPPANIDVDVIQDKSWLGAVKWTIKGFFTGLWYLIRTAVPLMLLAGFLGNILITFLPLEGFIQLTEAASTTESVLLMVGLAALGTFLPVPMAFDVLITAILWAGGLPAKYAMTLLFTLGSFSIYSAFIVDKSFSRKLAVAMFAIVTTIGMINGTLGHFLEKQLTVNYIYDHYQIVKDSDGPPEDYVVKAKDTILLTSSQLNTMTSDRVKRGDLLWSERNVQVSGTPFKSKISESQDWFLPIEGQEIGMDVPYIFSPIYTQDGLANQRSMSAGDIHGDGYPDLLMASANNLFLYANISGKTFQRQSLNVPDSLDIFGGTLIDLDNDGWLDVFFTTYRGGNYVKYSNKGSFDDDTLSRLPQTDDMVLSVSAAFGDRNDDGLLDIFVGNWTMGVNGGSIYSIPASQNFWLTNKGGRRFELQLASAPPGETLSTLLSDVIGDDSQDLVVGNDFVMPDYFYKGDRSTGEHELVLNPRDLVQKTTMTTMSITTVDVDNDLEFEIYEAQTDNRNSDFRTTNIEKICGAIKNDEQRGSCQALFKKHQAYLGTLVHKKFEHCEEEDLLDCIAFQLLRQKMINEKLGKPEDYFTPAWPKYDFIANFKTDQYERAEKYLETAPDAKRPGGVLLKKDESGKYIGQTDKYGLRVTGWAWNSRFADLDNDEWQDLYITNGYLFKPVQESNMFYKNLKGQTFEEQTDTSGLVNYLPSSSNSYVDFDLDGDLDIVLATSVGPVYLYENNNHQNNSIMFKLVDELGNRFGIGSKVTIYYGDGKHQVRELLASGGYKSYDDLTLHFGLSEYEQVDKLIVKWSTGEQTVIDTPLKSGFLYSIKRADHVK
ncbi:FG-GAP-like repeat-containing protein [Roseivirga sp. E12]|uniref:FG-GAP-like repeat-containing protein n=1 Tax=Roseivirga sp. E12 TaxID=2819237 RepID=UPI001ABD2A01|nr:FG-GAP-like repeat-containing protein [Roseivirga sp. E12]MBO3699048.1 VCBS repeat-containing protein [Roseivirga sp. E12]